MVILRIILLISNLTEWVWEIRDLELVGAHIYHNVHVHGFESVFLIITREDVLIYGYSNCKSPRCDACLVPFHWIIPIHRAFYIAQCFLTTNSPQLKPKPQVSNVQSLMKQTATHVHSSEL